MYYGPTAIHHSYFLTGEKPLFLLFGFDCRHLTEAATLPIKPLNTTEVTDYREEMVLNVSSARTLAPKFILKYSRTRRISTMIDILANSSKLKVSDWTSLTIKMVAINIKLSRPCMACAQGHQEDLGGPGKIKNVRPHT